MRYKYHYVIQTYQGEQFHITTEYDDINTFIARFITDQEFVGNEYTQVRTRDISNIKKINIE